MCFLFLGDWTWSLGRRTAGRADGDLGVEDVFAAGASAVGGGVRGSLCLSWTRACLPHGGDAQSRGYKQVPAGQTKVLWRRLGESHNSPGVPDRCGYGWCAVCRVPGESLRRHVQATYLVSSSKTHRAALTAGQAHFGCTTTRTHHHVLGPASLSPPTVTTFTLTLLSDRPSHYSRCIRRPLLKQHPSPPPPPPPPPTPAPMFPAREHS